MSIYQTIKKYFLFLSVFFVLITSTHLVLLYLVEDSVRTPEKGGTITIGFVGSVPSLNPAAYGTDPAGDYLLRFLSRSLLRYNVETKQMEGDIANCNLGKNFSDIKCYIKNEASWSDGNLITKEDILATYDLLKNTDTNKSAKKLLENITIEDQGEYIQFSGKADVLILDMLLYPIIQKDTIEKIRGGHFAVNENLSAGPYIFEKRESDEKTKSEKISFVKNEQNEKEKIYIQRYIFRFFQDKNDLLASKDILNAVFPNSTINSIPSPRFDGYRFVFPEYIGLFFNADVIGPELRNLLLGSFAKTKFSSLDEQTGKLLNNPFFTDESMLPTNFEAAKIETAMKNLGYFKKDALLVELTKSKTENKTPSTNENVYFTNPNTKYLVTTETDLLLSGDTPADLTGVYINDYRLKSFSPKEKKFYYRATTNLGTLKKGENTYTLAFEIGGQKVPKETITIFFASTQEEANTQKKISEERLQAEKNRLISEEQKSTQAQETLTDKITPLDPLLYYNKDLKKFTLQFAYTKQTPYMETLATEIAEHMRIF